jgi:hypothetical protein
MKKSAQNVGYSSSEREECVARKNIIPIMKIYCPEQLNERRSLLPKLIRSTSHTHTHTKKSERAKWDLRNSPPYQGFSVAPQCI